MTRKNVIGKVTPKLIEITCILFAVTFETSELMTLLNINSKIRLILSHGAVITNNEK